MSISVKQTENQAAKPTATNTSFFGGVGSAPFFQAKLTVNHPGDEHEREADAVADQVMRMRTGDAPIVQRMAISPVVQRACAQCEEDKQKEHEGVQRKESGRADASGQAAPSIVSDVLSSGGGQPMESGTKQFMESRFGQDFSQVRIHTDASAAESASAIQARAYTSGRDVVFGSGEYEPGSEGGRRLLAHELVHVGQQGASNALSTKSLIQRQKKKTEPYIKKITVNLTPKQKATLEWAGTPPNGENSFTVSTGKGYADPWDPAGTCLRTCCGNAETQCDAPFNKPSKTGACCTYVGSNFYTGVAEARPDGWHWWTPIQPYYSKRSIALHTHHEVTGEPIGHGCVRMLEDNAKRIYDYSVAGHTKVVIEGRASPVKCDNDRKCAQKQDDKSESQPNQNLPSESKEETPR